jgi:hypothetical protein
MIQTWHASRRPLAEPCPSGKELRVAPPNDAVSHPCVTGAGQPAGGVPLTRRNTMRKLTLKKETLVELTTVELTGVVGGAPTVKDLCGGPTLSLTCGSAVDACITAQACTR